MKHSLKHMVQEFKAISAMNFLLQKQSRPPFSLHWIAEGIGFDRKLKFLGPIRDRSLLETGV